MYELGRALAEQDYGFATVTPATHELLLSRRQGGRARNLRDVFGWNLPFRRELLPPALFEQLRAAEVCTRTDGDSWRANVRFSTLDGLLLAHSGFPTNETDAVFFGPDSIRFVAALKRCAPHPVARLVDVGCGTGVGGIALARYWGGRTQLTLADISRTALSFARVNAALNGVDAEVVESDVLKNVPGDLDVVIANPPYLNDESQRLYRHGGGEHGEALSVRIVQECAERLCRQALGGSLLVYTGVAIVDGDDAFLNATVPRLRLAGMRARYEELDPDVFSDELTRPAYRDVERIAAVLLSAEI